MNTLPRRREAAAPPPHARRANGAAPPRFPLRLAAALALLMACGGDGGPARDAGPSDTAVHDDAGAPAHEDPRSHGACARYIACVREATPQATTAIIATYGEEGSCWNLPGVTAEDCNLECAAQLDSVATAYPDAAACQECTSSAQCDEGEHCVRGRCQTPGECTTTCETSADCGADGTSRCVAGACVADGCQTSEDCGGAPLICAAYQGRRFCTVPCKQASDCPDLDVVGQCSDARDAHGTGLCVWPCIADTQCNDGFSDAPGQQPLCRQDGQCGCYDDGACSPGQKCLPVPAGPR